MAHHPGGSQLRASSSAYLEGDTLEKRTLEELRDDIQVREKAIAYLLDKDINVVATIMNDPVFRVLYRKYYDSGAPMNDMVAALVCLLLVTLKDLKMKDFIYTTLKGEAA